MPSNLIKAMPDQEALTTQSDQASKGTNTASSAKVIKPTKAEIDTLRESFSENFSPRPTRHDKASVLLLSWRKEDSDLDVQPEVDALSDVFKDKYNFKVDHQLLDLMGENPQTKVNKIVANFVDENNAKNALLIVYYAGHGMTVKGELYMQGKAGAGQSDIAAKKRSLAWSAAENNLYDLSSDVFVIFDCCYAGSLIGRSHAAFDYLAACGDKQRAANPGPKSFTTGLVNALKSLRAENRPFSSIQLKDRINKLGTVSKRQRLCLSPRVKGDESDSPRVTITPQNLDIQDEEQRNAALGHYQELDHDYIDLRFQFFRKLQPGDIEKVARGLSLLLNSDLPDTADFPARHVYLKHKASYRNAIVHYAKRWQETYEDGKARSSSTSTPPAIAVTTADLEDNERVVEEDDAMLSPMTPRVQQRNYPESIGSVESDMTATETSRLLPRSQPSDSSEADDGVMFHLKMFIQCLWMLFVCLLSRIAAWVHSFFAKFQEWWQENRQEASLSSPGRKKSILPT